MRKRIILIISEQFFKTLLKNKATRWLIATLSMLLLMSTFLGWDNYQQQHELRSNYQKLIRKQWVSNPDKHPHRMAHYGYFAFRPKHPLSFFDFGMESFTGVSLFLEAHKQNTVNFSEASLSTGILRFGEMSIAMILQLLVPLFLIFMGFNAVAAMKESSTLKIILSQGVSWQELVLGKTLGITAMALLLYLPVILITVLLWMGLTGFQENSDDTVRLLLLLLSYMVYFAGWSLITVLISALSKTSKGALTTLTGIWIFTILVIPRGAQALGAYSYPTPSKAAFEAALEHDLKKDGDRHNPGDPKFKAIKDSLLNKYAVDSVSQLPFNYAGFLMYKGEQISSEIYNFHRNELLDRYRQQNSFNRYSSFINPYIAIKNLSMALTGSDFESYADFQEQAETFRYSLAQRMNKLQMDHISNKKQGDHDKPYSISRQHWEDMPDFKYQFNTTEFVLKNEWLSIAALMLWLIFPIVLLFTITKKFKSL